MRGYEVIWTDLGALRYDVAHCLDREDESTVAWPIVDRSKARNGVLDCFMVPIAGTLRRVPNSLHGHSDFWGDWQRKATKMDGPTRDQIVSKQKHLITAVIFSPSWRRSKPLQA